MPRLLAAIALIGSILAFATTAEAGRLNCNSKRTRDTPNCTAPSVVTNNPPSISGTPAVSVSTGTSYMFTPAASDPDGNALNFQIANRPPWASFNATSGKLSGTPTAAAVGEYVEIAISVSDGVAVTSLTPFSITVLQGNRPPTIAGNPPTTAREGQAYAFTPSASDADGNSLLFSVVNRPAWAQFNAANGSLTGTPGTGTVGSYSSVTIRVSDGIETTSLPAFSIAVQQAALGSATLSWQAPTTRTDGSPLTNLAGYRIRYGTAAGSYPNLIDIPNGSLTSAMIENLPAATYYFVVSAYDATGAESDNTAPVTKTIS